MQVQAGRVGSYPRMGKSMKRRADRTAEIDLQVKRMISDRRTTKNTRARSERQSVCVCVIEYVWLIDESANLHH